MTVLYEANKKDGDNLAKHCDMLDSHQWNFNVGIFRLNLHIENKMGIYDDFIAPLECCKAFMEVK